VHACLDGYHLYFVLISPFYSVVYTTLHRLLVFFSIIHNLYNICVITEPQVRHPMCRGARKNQGRMWWRQVCPADLSWRMLYLEAQEQSREWVDGSWIMGQMGHENRMGHMGHGSLGVDPW